MVKKIVFVGKSPGKRKKKHDILISIKNLCQKPRTVNEIATKLKINWQTAKVNCVLLEELSILTHYQKKHNDSVKATYYVEYQGFLRKKALKEFMKEKKKGDGN